MNGEQVNDLIISGSGSAGGGTYKAVDISGSGRIQGDIECEDFKISGSGRVEGSVKARFIHTSGSARIKGNAESEDIVVSGSAHFFGDVVSNDIEVSGSADIDGRLAAKNLSVSGSTKVGKHLSGETIEVSGGLTVKENCEAETFKVKGGFRIGGLLNADHVDITLYFDKATVREIGGETIEVRKGMKRFGFDKWFGGIFSRELTVDVVEGDDIYLESTHAKVVRGNRVRIGKDCNIELVEYKKSVDISDQAKVGEQKQI
ncbi:polymer-forming cytoskeletal protein [Camelliibacillus cellulosilyticus]|uniref:Polymer-forming cytoskeletal protein n=1 Tax=Camelliibacillus cellulosilyticus TaxID=2174486 RepID=A0ABV9GK62_9BACL